MLGTLKLNIGKYNSTSLHEDIFGIISYGNFLRIYLSYIIARWGGKRLMRVFRVPTAGKWYGKLPSHTGLLCCQCIVFSNRNLPLNIVLAINVIIIPKKILEFFAKSRHAKYLLSVDISFFSPLPLQRAWVGMRTLNTIPQKTFHFWGLSIDSFIHSVNHCENTGCGWTCQMGI